MLIESDNATIAVPPCPSEGDDPEALFEEARQHRRERRLRLALVATLAIIAAVGAYTAFGGASGSSGGGTGSTLPVVTAANPTVVLLVDVSGSMSARDISPTRIMAVENAMMELVDRLPKRSQVGVVTFSSTAQVRVAPTLDRKLVRLTLGSLSPESGTALGAGLAAAVRLTVGSLAKDGVRAAAGHALPAEIVLASDGAQNRGALSPLQAAKLARAAGIHVDAIALGTPHGVANTGAGEYREWIPVPPDPKVVRLIASVTGGESFDARSAGRLDSIYEQLGASIGR